MKIRPLDNWKLLGTSIVMDVNRVYDAVDATNQPDWEKLGLIFADVDGTGFLLNASEYKKLTYEEEFANRYEVVVGNVGNVHTGPYLKNALKAFREYVNQSKSGCGRAGGEDVTLFDRGEIYREYRPTIKWFTIREIKDLLVSLKSVIDDDCRCSDDPDDNRAGIQVTISTDDGSSWNFQTGDNSFSGACYGDNHWSAVYLYRNSNCMELARDAVNELKDMVAEAAV